MPGAGAILPAPTTTRRRASSQRETLGLRASVQLFNSHEGSVNGLTLFLGKHKSVCQLGMWAGLATNTGLWGRWLTRIPERWASMPAGRRALFTARQKGKEALCLQVTSACWHVPRSCSHLLFCGQGCLMLLRNSLEGGEPKLQVALPRFRPQL